MLPLDIETYATAETYRRGREAETFATSMRMQRLLGAARRLARAAAVARGEERRAVASPRISGLTGV